MRESGDTVNMDLYMAKEIVRDLEPSAASWIPEPSLDGLINGILSGETPEQSMARLGGEDRINARFSLDVAREVICLVFALKSTWDAVAFIDKVAGLVVDDNKKLEIVEQVVRRLRQAGLQMPAQRIEKWVEKILERLTSPTSD